MANHDEDTFVKITNKDIYLKLIQIEKTVKETNGKVKLNRWISTTALSIALIIAGWFVGHLVSISK